MRNEDAAAADCADEEEEEEDEDCDFLPGAGRATMGEFKKVPRRENAERTLLQVELS